MTLGPLNHGSIDLAIAISILPHQDPTLELLVHQKLPSKHQLPTGVGQPQHFPAQILFTVPLQWLLLPSRRLFSPMISVIHRRKHIGYHCNQEFELRPGFPPQPLVFRPSQNAVQSVAPLLLLLQERYCQCQAPAGTSVNRVFRMSIQLLIVFWDQFHPVNSNSARLLNLVP